MNEKAAVKNDCVNFYNKSIDIFKGNVRDKLRSLVDNIDFAQLWVIPCFYLLVLGLAKLI